MFSTRSESFRALVRRYVVALGIAFVLLVGSLVGVNVFIDKKIEAIPRVKVNLSRDTDPGQPANFVLLGSDTRANLTPEEQQAYGNAAQEGGKRSDTLMVVHVDPAQRKGVLVSFPRDLLVNIPGVGRSKINAAYNYGPQKVVDTLQSVFGISVQHYMEVDFVSFKAIVDAMGGVQIYFPAPTRDQKSDLEVIPFGFKPGCFTLDGNQALGYARSREYEEYIDGRWQKTGQDAPDLHRIERQQTFMRRLAAEAFQKSIADPLAANRIAGKTLPKLKVDSELSRDDINKLINAFRRVDPNDPNSIQMITLPTVAGPRFQGQDVLQLQEPDADQILGLLGNPSNAPPTAAPHRPAPSSIRVRIFNGSGIKGVAGATMAALRKVGFVDAGVGNNPAGRLAQTEIRYRPDSQAKAQVLQSYFGGIGKLIPDDTIVEAHITVVLGRDFKAITTSANSGTAGSQGSAASNPPSATQPVGRTPSTPKGVPSNAPPPNPTQC
jgi:LCP family protein required for cell wall assembly